MVHVLLSTIHGSHLYGTHRPDSDHDTYQVVLSGRTRQRQRGVDDAMTITLEDFSRQVAIGVPQALEALWSPVAQVDPTWGPWFAGLRPGLPAAIDRHRRTALSFGLYDGGRHGRGLERARTSEKIKLRRHALRLAHNLYHLASHGWYDPVLAPEQVRQLDELARLEDHAYERILRERVAQALDARWPCG